MFELLSASEFRKKLTTGAKLGIVDARRADAYKAGHIPGAINLLWEQWCEDAPVDTSAILHQPGWWGRLKDISPFELGEKLGDLGISSVQQIVVYADGVKSKGRDGRIAWMLLYFGAENVSILNGGWDAWLRTDGDVELEHKVLKKSSFEVHFDSGRRIQLNDLIDAEISRGIDTRTKEEHQGAIYIYQPRLGRIPNSVNIPFSTLYTSDGKFLNRNEFLNTLRSNERDKSAEATRPVYSYCEVGVRAATFSLLYELYTGNKLPVFDGSFMEWAYHQELPIERD